MEPLQQRVQHKAKGDQNRCRKALEQSVKLNPKNVEARRELRLIKMRMEKSKSGGGGGLFDGLIESFNKLRQRGK